jgi:hypothetical protein
MGRHVLTPRIWLPLAILLVSAGCREPLAPPDAQHAPGVAASLSALSANVHIIQQAPTAPPLETYQVSFWAYRGKASTVRVNYRSVEHEREEAQPFLRFDIPLRGLRAGAHGARLRRGDSVYVTLTIDPVRFVVDFQPSGVLFSKDHPANLTFWYENANPDLNGDGVVDATDRALLQQLGMWYHAAAKDHWVESKTSDNDQALRSVSGALYHFSEYAVSFSEYAVSW